MKESGRLQRIAAFSSVEAIFDELKPRDALELSAAVFCCLVANVTESRMAAAVAKVLDCGSSLCVSSSSSGNVYARQAQELLASGPAALEYAVQNLLTVMALAEIEPNQLQSNVSTPPSEGELQAGTKSSESPARLAELVREMSSLESVLKGDDASLELCKPTMQVISRQEVDMSDTTSIHRSTKVEPASVVKYQLTPSLESVIPGDEKPIHLLVLGPTGAGKSTTINSLINFLFGVKQSDNFRFKVVWEKDERKDDRAGSQTSDIVVYVVPKTILDRKVVIIDTPGFGDTRGLAYDSRTLTLLKKLFASSDLEMSTLTAVCLVIKSSETVLSATLKYQISQVSSLFGKDLGARLTPLLTFCDGSKPPAIAALKKADVCEINKTFSFNNSAFFEPDAMEMFWNLGITCFERFTGEISNWQLISTKNSADVLSYRRKLECTAAGLQNQIRALTQENNVKKEELAALSQINLEVESNKNFKYKVSETVSKQVNISGTGRYVTNCLLCNSTCHANCAYANDNDKKYCSAMGGENCRICPNKCHWSKHVNNGFYYENETVEVEKTYQEMMAKYKIKSTEKQAKLLLVEKIERGIAENREQSIKMIRELKATLSKLEKLAHRQPNGSEVEFIEQLIIASEQDKKSGWENFVAELKLYKEIALVIQAASSPDEEAELLESLLQENKCFPDISSAAASPPKISAAVRVESQESTLTTKAFRGLMGMFNKTR
ncbi:hypothetical protein DFJ73DRAFT_796982 [Zopfochytrium polystomum]|nr:hypothetical protein DFJ73DRAFT_796982 [Zopfochytrium polystomum]